MVRIYTLTLAPSLDSATITPQIYPEGKLRCTAPVFEPGGGGINVARAIAHLGGSATAIFPAGGATGEHLVSLLADENVPVATVEAKDWTRQNLHVHVEMSKVEHDRINAFLVFLPGIHKFQQRNQCRDQCRYKNHPTQNPFQNSNASSLLIRHEFSLIKTRRFT